MSTTAATLRNALISIYRHKFLIKAPPSEHIITSQQTCIVHEKQSPSQSQIDNKLGKDGIYRTNSRLFHVSRALKILFCTREMSLLFAHHFDASKISVTVVVLSTLHNAPHGGQIHEERVVCSLKDPCNVAVIHDHELNCHKDDDLLLWQATRSISFPVERGSDETCLT